LKSSDNIRLFLKAIPNSYGQVFFSDHKLFSWILLVVTFFDLNAGLMGLLSVITTNLVGFLLGFDKRTISKGVFGFNSLLVGLGLGVYFQPSVHLTLIILMAAILTLLIAVSLQGVIGKYALPYLSVPFLISIWIMTLATKEFTALGISERGIYTFNDLYTIPWSGSTNGGMICNCPNHCGFISFPWEPSCFSTTCFPGSCSAWACCSIPGSPFPCR
jgi:urea transporter